MKRQKIIFYLITFIILLVISPISVRGVNIVKNPKPTISYEQFECNLRVRCKLKSSLVTPGLCSVTIDGEEETTGTRRGTVTKTFDNLSKTKHEIICRCNYKDSIDNGYSSETKKTVYLDEKPRYYYKYREYDNNGDEIKENSTRTVKNWSTASNAHNAKWCEENISKDTVVGKFLQRRGDCGEKVCGGTGIPSGNPPEPAPKKTCEDLKNDCKKTATSDEAIALCLFTKRASCCKDYYYDDYKNVATPYESWHEFVNGLGLGNGLPTEVYNECDYDCPSSLGNLCCEQLIRINPNDPASVIEKELSCCNNYKNSYTKEKWKEFVKNNSDLIKEAVDRGYVSCTDCDIEIITGNYSDSDGDNNSGTGNNASSSVVSTCDSKLNSGSQSSGNITITNFIKEEVKNDDDCVIIPAESRPENEDGTLIGTVTVNDETHSYCTMTCFDELKYTYPTTFKVPTGYRFTIGTGNDTDIGSIKYVLTKSCKTTKFNYTQFEKDYKYYSKQIKDKELTYEKAKEGLKNCPSTDTDCIGKYSAIIGYYDAIDKIVKSMEACTNGQAVSVDSITAPRLLFEYGSDLEAPLAADTNLEKSSTHKTTVASFKIYDDSADEYHYKKATGNFENKVVITWTYKIDDAYMTFIDKMTGDSYSQGDNYSGESYKTEASIPISYSAKIGTNNSYKIKLTECGSLKTSFCDIIKKANSGEYTCNYETTKGLNVVYRPISLTNPFPGINGSGRLTGSNWCSDDDCTNENDVVKEVILNSGDEVYNKTPLYTITLTPSLINEIRKYNKEHEYGDFNLKCTKGINCKSSFIRDEFKDYFTGCTLDETC